MTGDGLIFLVSVIVSALLVFGTVFFVVMLSDLENDYINPIDLCNKLNQLIIPEMGVHALLFVLFLASGRWLAMLLNLPLLVYNVEKIRSRRHVYDATEIFRMLPQHKKESFIKLGFYVLLFFFSLYRMISGLLTTD